MLTRRWLNGPATDEPLAFETYTATTAPASGIARDLQADRLGSILRVVNPTTGQVDAEYSYDSFGARSQTGTLTQRFGFTGREHDVESNLIYFRAREYDPSTGQFLQRDPIGFAGGDMNQYNYVWSDYVWSDPYNFTDPSGLAGVKAIGRTAVLGEWLGLAAEAFYEGAQAINVLSRYCMANPYCKGGVNQGIRQGLDALGEALGLGAPDGSSIPASSSGDGVIGSIFSGILGMVDKITDKLDNIVKNMASDGQGGDGAGPGGGGDGAGGDDPGGDGPNPKKSETAKDGDLDKIAEQNGYSGKGRGHKWKKDEGYDSTYNIYVDRRTGDVWAGPRFVKSGKGFEYIGRYQL